MKLLEKAEIEKKRKKYINNVDIEESESNET